MDGEVITEVFNYVSTNPIREVPTLDIPTRRTTKCCEELVFKALAHTVDADTYKNDIWGANKWLPETVITVGMKLMKFNESTLNYDQVATLNNATYGTLYTFGTYTNTLNQKFVGYDLEWRKVLQLQGEGSYHIDFDVTAIGGSQTISDFDFCLKTYTADRADGTIRLEWYYNGFIGDYENDLNKKDYGSINWRTQMRLNGFFGYPATSFNKDFIQYNNGQRLYVKSEQEKEFVMKLKPVQAGVHNLLSVDFMDADKILITDYNSVNADRFIDKDVLPTSDYAPDWKPLQSKAASVEVKFQQTFNNLKKTRC